MHTTLSSLSSRSRIFGHSLPSVSRESLLQAHTFNLSHSLCASTRNSSCGCHQHSVAQSPPRNEGCVCKGLRSVEGCDQGWVGLCPCPSSCLLCLEFRLNYTSQPGRHFGVLRHSGHRYRHGIHHLALQCGDACSLTYRRHLGWGRGST